MASLGLPCTGSWLSVVPSPALGLHLRAAELIPVLKYRLGIPVYTTDGPCPACSLPSDRMGDHSLGCAKTGDRIARHNILRDVIFETAASADLGPTNQGGETLVARHHCSPWRCHHPAMVKWEGWRHRCDSHQPTGSL